MGRKKSKKNPAFAARLKALMQEGKWTQSQMAEKVGVSQQTVAKWLQGNVPTWGYISELATANGVSETYLLPVLNPIKALGAQINRGLQTTQEIEPQKPIDNVSESVNIKAVKPQLPILLEKLKNATKQRGQKSALAKFLGVPLARVSQWLSGDRQPGGETTLRMLQWVEAQERQK